MPGIDVEKISLLLHDYIYVLYWLSYSSIGVVVRYITTLSEVYNWW